MQNLIIHIKKYFKSIFASIYYFKSSLIIVNRFTVVINNIMARLINNNSAVFHLNEM